MPLTLPPGVVYRQIKTLNVAVTTSAIQVDTEVNKASIAGFKWIVLFNNNASGENSIFMGHSSAVTTATGLPIVAQDYWLLGCEDAPTFDLWAIAGGSSDLRVMFLA